MNAAKKRLVDAWIEFKKRTHPLLPENVIVAPNYNERNSNGTTKMIRDWLYIHGHHVERINTTGRMIDETKVVTDVLGGHRRIGSVRWIPTAGQRGSADLHALINGRAVYIEVKHGADTQTEAQKEFQRSVEANGGLYWLVYSFEEFLNLYDNLINN